jgi:PAS domain S-box-containing protein
MERQRDALGKSEKELRDVIDTISAIVWSALPDGSNTYNNNRFVEYSGLSAEQTAGSGWQAAIHPDDLERHAVKWREAVATGKPHENEGVCAARMGNIAGIWTAECRSEMKMEASSSGMGSRPTSKIANAEGRKS